jgi:hypothetical protein
MSIAVPTNTGLTSGIFHDGVRNPRNVEYHRVRAENLNVIHAHLSPVEYRTVTATGAFVGSVNMEFSFGQNPQTCEFNLQGFGPVASAANQVITLTTVVPAKYRPASIKYFLLPGMDNAANSQLLLTVNTSGTITIGVGLTGAAFTNTTNLAVYDFAGEYNLLN